MEGARRALHRIVLETRQAAAQRGEIADREWLALVQKYDGPNRLKEIVRDE